MKRLSLAILLLLLCSCGSREKIIDPISDNNRVFYEIFVGSFSDSDQDGIGDLRGIINRLDHLNDGDMDSKYSLGIQGIWLSPIFKAGSYHKYDVIDYYSIDPELGSEEDLVELIERCHERNVLVILDLAINHTSDQNEWFLRFRQAHEKNDTDDPYYDFYVYSSKDPNDDGHRYCPLDTDETYECNFSSEMPELNFDNETVRSEVLQIAEYYLSKGVDGFRFDAAKFVYLDNDRDSVAFWTWYADRLRAIKKDVYLVGEVWGEESQTDEYIRAMNCFDFTLAQSDGLIASTARGDNINGFTGYVVNYLDKIRNKNKDALLIPFISNHDMDRSAGYLNVDSGQVAFAANLYILLPGSPFIYYGEEIGMKGSRGGAATDANRRLAMLWGDGDTVRDPVGSDYPAANQSNGTVASQLGNSSSLLSHYQELIHFRNRHPEIIRGRFEMLDLHNDNVGGFRISYEGDTSYLIHNNSSSAMTVTGLGFQELADSIGNEGSTYKDGKLTIAPYTSVLMR